MDRQTTNVLFIEDNPGDADLVRLRLVEGTSPVSVNCVSLLSDGLASLTRETPSVVLLDLNLPRIGGDEVLKRVRLSPRCGSVKVLILSSSNAPLDRERTMKLGATDYFRKPSTLDQFMELGPKVRALMEEPAQ